MNFLKTLDQALDFEKLEKTVTETVGVVGAGLVEEFPDRNKAAPSNALTPAALAESREMCELWQQFEMERRKDEWEVACGELKALRGKDEASQGWQRRAQDAEFKLYQLYSTLLSLPDPAPFLFLLSTLAARVFDLEDQNRKLQTAADQAAKDDREVSGLIEKHQKLLESHKELQDELSRRDQRIAEVATAAQEAAAAKMEMSQQAAEMARLQRSLKSTKDEYEATQQSLFELQSRLENLVGSRQQEAELATEELDRVSKRAAELELERQQLLSRLESAQAGAAGETGSNGPAAGPGGAGPMEPGLLERQLALREEQVHALAASLEAAQRTAAEAGSRHAREMGTLQDQVTTTQLTLDRLEREVSRRPDPKEHLELRRRVEALQALVDVQMAAEGWSSEQVEATLRDTSPQAVTHVLQERCRKLSSEVSSLKRHMGERDKQIHELEERCRSLESDLQRRAALVARLEEDLAAAAGSAAAARGGAEVGAAASSLAPADGSGSLALGEPGTTGPGGAHLAMSPLGAAGLPEAAATSSGGGVAGDSGGGGSLLDILVSQRDRFRQRMVQLEEEKNSLTDELRRTRQQLESTRDGNVALIEKVRYLERYSQRAAASAGRTTVVRVDGAGVAQPAAAEEGRGSRYQCGPFALEVGAASRGAAAAPGGDRFGGGAAPPGGVGAAGIRSRGARRGGGSQLAACFGGGDDVESNASAEARAAKAYEARVNPFAEFQQSETELRVRNLQVHDRALLAGSRLVMGSRLARMAVVVYTVMLHFVILLLFFYATTPCAPAGPVLAAEPGLAAALAGLQPGVAAGGVQAAAAGVLQAGVQAAGAALQAGAGGAGVGGGAGAQQLG